MSEIKKYSDAIEGSLKNDELSKVNTDLAEVILDGALDNEVLKEVPFLGTIIGLAKAGVGMREQLLVKKLISFLTELSDVPKEKRIKMIDEIDSSGKFRIKVGEKLLYIIDKSEDYEKSQLIAKMFKGFIEERITYADFLRASKIIDNVHLEDLKFITETDFVDLDIDDDAGALIAAGLFEVDQISIKLQQVEEPTWDNAAGKHIIEGGKLKASITSIGRKIRELLRA